MTDVFHVRSKEYRVHGYQRKNYVMEVLWDRTSKELEVLGGVRITVSDPNPGRDGASKSRT